MTTKNLLVELFVEELPPKALKKLGESFAAVLFEQLAAQGLTTASSSVTSFASPRRLAAHVTAVVAQGADKPVSQKLLPVSVGLDAEGKPTAALLKKLQSIGADASVLPQLKRAMDGKAEALFYESTAKGAKLADALQKALAESIAKLPIPKVMTYQLADGWSDVKFVRPAHSLLALFGSDVVPVSVLGLTAGNTTQGHRFEAAKSPVTIADADSYAATLEKDGAVVASFAARKSAIVKQLQAAATNVGGNVKPIEDEALLDEVTALVERPNVLICEFEKQFLDVPQECLILTMKANQKYFPLLDAHGKLTNRFLVVSNISPADPSAVIAGNERVVRPRLADAKFFFDQDRKKKLADRVPALSNVVYHNKLGSQGARSERVCALAGEIAAHIGADVTAATRAATLAKADLLTDMVGEFPELQGTMGRYYALHDGEARDVADAIAQHYQPRFAGDALPESKVAIAVALADKMETLAGLFSIGQVPTGDKDPFALRRHALGVLRMLVERDLNLTVPGLIALAMKPFGNSAAGSSEQLATYIFERLSGYLREFGYSTLEVDAAIAPRPPWGEFPQRLAAIREFTKLPEAESLAAANKRIGNILKKSDAVDASVDPALFVESAERGLLDAIEQVRPQFDREFSARNYTPALKLLAPLKAPVDAFFDGVMVNAEDVKLRNNRLALLRDLHALMNKVADLSKLAA
jgi:glycyl-tRNA synthetase beta chain